MNKKNFFLIIIILLLFVGGVFLWKRGDQEKEIWDVHKYSKPDDYVVKEAENGKIVENKKAGLKVEVLEGWQAEIKGVWGEGVANFLSPDAESFLNGNFKEGCWVWIEILDCSDEEAIIRAEWEQVQETISDFLGDPSKLEETDYKIREIGEFIGLEEKRIRKIDDNREIIQVSVKIPVDEKLYWLHGVLIPPSEERYSQFENFLNTVSIE